MNSLPLQPYDVFMLAVIVLTTIFGAWKGMAWQLASLASLVSAVSVPASVRLASACQSNAEPPPSSAALTAMSPPKMKMLPIATVKNNVIRAFRIFVTRYLSSASSPS